jgi:ribulose-phosphate 3-epimerase
VTRPDRCLIAASILDADFGHLSDEVRRAADGGVDRLHLDVMDAHFVPNLTFGWRTIEAVRDLTDIPFDAHLMIAEPGRWIGRFIDAGCDSVTFHVEVEPSQIRPALAAIRKAGRLAGLSVKPLTSVEALTPYRDLLDIVLVMTVEPGFGGQVFMEDVARTKLRAAREYLDPAGACEIQVDGGGSRHTAELIGREGTDVIVVGSALYRAPDLATEVVVIRGIADTARLEGERAQVAGG